MSEQKRIDLLYAQPQPNAKGRLWAKGTLKHGLKIGEVVHRDFELQEAITQDLIAAEGDAPASNAIAFNAALLARQLVRIGAFEGPFTQGMIGELRTLDFNRLRSAQLELDLLGEIEGGGSPLSVTPSSSSP